MLTASIFPLNLTSRSVSQSAIRRFFWIKIIKGTFFVIRESRNMGAQNWVNKNWDLPMFFFILNAHVSLFYLMGAAPMGRPCFFLTPMIFFFFDWLFHFFCTCIFWVPSAHCPVPRARHDRILSTTAGRRPEFSTSYKWQRHTSLGPSSVRCLHVAHASLPLD